MAHASDRLKTQNRFTNDSDRARKIPKNVHRNGAFDLFDRLRSDRVFKLFEKYSAVKTATT